MDDGKLSPSYKNFALTISSTFEANFYHQVTSHEHLRIAIKDELKVKEANKTWFVATLPSSKHSIGCKWVYKVKFKVDGTIERYKAPLVAKGYTQQDGLDYVKIFSPIAKLVTIIVLLTTTTSLN